MDAPSEKTDAILNGDHVYQEALDELMLQMEEAISPQKKTYVELEEAYEALICRQTSECREVEDQMKLDYRLKILALQEQYEVEHRLEILAIQEQHEAVKRICA